MQYIVKQQRKYATQNNHIPKLHHALYHPVANTTEYNCSVLFCHLHTSNYLIESD